jgi:hypothetical protein
MAHRVVWAPIVEGYAALLLDGRPVGVARRNWRKQLEVRFRFNGREYSYRGRDAYRDARWALLALLDTVEWMA